jgi:L-alanine-DL-glutamate epimerase-like enolase superfamily enzyme
MRRLTARIEAWPMRGTFRISRGAKTEARTVVVEITDGDHAGRGESVPYPRYDETPEGVVGEIESLRATIEGALARDDLLGALHAGAARNAIDCALWDLEAKQTGRRAWDLAGLSEPAPCATAMTLSLDTPEKMGEAAAGYADLPLLKLKVTGEGDLARIRAVHENAPNARLIVDANEGWTPPMLDEFLPAFADLGVEMVEQPIPASDDAVLADRTFALPLCADESCHTRADLERLAGRYQVVNVKLDKTGGLTEALSLVAEAKTMGFRLMIGCMIGTSLAMAPATLLTAGADWVDLDGPLLLAKDREPGLRYRGTMLEPPTTELWG